MYEKKVLLLDADGVIFYCDTVISSIKKALLEMCLDLRLVEEAYEDLESKSLIYDPREWIKSFDQEQQHWRDIFKQFSEILCKKIPGLNFEKVNEVLCDKAVYYRNCHLFNDVIAFLEKASKKFELSILTNAYPSIFSILSSLGINSYFYKVFSSSDLHMCKPTKEIFLLVARELRVETKSIYFVDDNFENVKAAQSLNINSFLLRNTKHQGVNCANDLNELWRYLGE